MWLAIVAIVALAGGIYVGLGAPGFPGRQDRFVASGRAQRLRHRHIHWIRQDRSQRR
jgi:hypothetical protein